jgi:very-short-patch-repair endonuclease
LAQFLDVYVLFRDTDSGDDAGMPDEPEVSAAIRRELQLQAVAERQDGLVTVGQLHALGYSESAISRRVRAGRLHRIHRGVYAVGRAELSQAGRFRAALLAIGDDAVLSHISGAVHLGFWTYKVPETVDIIAPRDLSSRPGIRVHRVATLHRRAITIWRGLRVTTPARTALDLAATLPDQNVFERAVHEALVQEVTDLRRLQAEIDRAGPRARGAARLAADIADGAKPTRSGLEDWGVRLLRRRHFPAFETNVHPPGTPRGINVDVLFIPQRFVIEFDGDKYHRTAYRRKRDAAKQEIVEGANYRMLRLNDDDALPQYEERTVGLIWHGLGESPG